MAARCLVTEEFGGGSCGWTFAVGWAGHASRLETSMLEELLRG